MNRNNDGSVSRSTNDWGLALPCGHEILVPWDSPVPLMMGCAVRHQRDCREESWGGATGERRRPEVSTEGGARP